MGSPSFIAISIFFRSSSAIICEGLNGLLIMTPIHATVLSAPPTRYAGAIRTWRSTPTLQYSITPRGRIRGRGRRRVRSPFGAETDASLKRVSDTPVNFHEVISGAADEVIIGFTEDTYVRCKPVFQTGAGVSKHVIVSVSPAFKPETIGDEMPKTA